MNLFLEFSFDSVGVGTLIYIKEHGSQLISVGSVNNFDCGRWVLIGFVCNLENSWGKKI